MAANQLYQSRILAEPKDSSDDAPITSLLQAAANASVIPWFLIDVLFEDQLAGRCVILQLPPHSFSPHHTLYSIPSRIPFLVSNLDSDNFYASHNSNELRTTNLSLRKKLSRIAELFKYTI